MPGTLIEAFCIDGSYYKVNSINDGTTKHPFVLNLPTNVDCRLVMTTNENDPIASNRIVTPIELSDSGTISNYFSLEGYQDIGYIPLSTNGSGIQATLTVDISESKNLKLKEYLNDPLDNDNDGVPNSYEDDDNDGIYNKDDSQDNSQNDNDDKEENDNEKDDDDTNNNSNISSTLTLPTSYSQNDGRLLASQCFQCHGTNGVSTNSWDSIAGEDEMDEVFGEDAIMDAQAHGYTTQELNLIGSYLKTLSRNND